MTKNKVYFIIFFMKICVINFSGRKNGNCRNIAEKILSFYKDKTDYFDFSNTEISGCGKCDYQCFKRRDNCPYISDDAAKIYNSVTQSDISFFIVPNYCDYPCANYFAFNERSQCVFQGDYIFLDKYLKAKKKFIVVSNGDKQNFYKAFEYQVEDGEKADVLFLSAKKYGKKSIDGDLTQSSAALQDIEKFIAQN